MDNFLRSVKLYSKKHILTKALAAVSQLTILISSLSFTSFTYLEKYKITSDEKIKEVNFNQVDIEDFIISYNFEIDDEIIPVADFEEELDVDPLSNLKDEYYINNLDLLPMDIDELIDKYSKYFDHPGTPFVFRQKRIISPDDYEIVENIVLGEVSYCSFEQMVAEASLCINIMQQENTDMKDLVMRPGVFSEKYAEKTMESTEEVTAAIEAAVYGLDFSCGATAACTYDWMDDSNKAWFDTLHETVKIEDSSFYCDPDNILSENMYYFSEDSNRVEIFN